MCMCISTCLLDVYILDADVKVKSWRCAFLGGNYHRALAGCGELNELGDLVVHDNLQKILLLFRKGTNFNKKVRKFSSKFYLLG